MRGGGRGGLLLVQREVEGGPRTGGDHDKGGRTPQPGALPGTPLRVDRVAGRPAPPDVGGLEDLAEVIGTLRGYDDEPPRPAPAVVRRAGRGQEHLPQLGTVWTWISQ